jgi:hypothetical protein
MLLPSPCAAEDLLGEAVQSAYQQRLVKPMDYVVCIMSHRGSLVVKVVQVRAGRWWQIRVLLPGMLGRWTRSVLYRRSGALLA